MSCMSAYSMPLCTIFTKCPAPSGPMCETQGVPSAAFAEIFSSSGPREVYDSAGPPGMMLGPSSAPSSPPEMPAPTKWMPCSRSSRSRRRVSSKWALPPSMITSPSSRSSANSRITASVGSPAFTMTIRRRGRSSASTNSFADSAATKEPSCPNSSTRAWVFAAVRLWTATVNPLRAKFRARLLPITASPVTPIWAVLLLMRALLRASMCGDPRRYIDRDVRARPLCTDSQLHLEAGWL